MKLTKAEIEEYFHLPPGAIDKYLDALQINPEEFVRSMRTPSTTMLASKVEDSLLTQLDIPSILARVAKFNSPKFSTSQEAKVIDDGKQWVKKFVGNPKLSPDDVSEGVIAAAGVWQAILDNSYNHYFSLRSVALQFDIKPQLVSDFLAKMLFSPISEYKQIHKNIGDHTDYKIDLNDIVKAVKYNERGTSYLKTIVGSDSIFPPEITLNPISTPNSITTLATNTIDFDSEPDSECIDVSKYLTHAEYLQIQADAMARQDSVILIGGSPNLRPLRCILDFTANQCIISPHVAKSVMPVVPLTNPYYCSSDKYHKIKCFAMGRLTVYLDDEHPIDLNIYVAENNLPDTDIIIGSTAIGRYGLQYSDDDIIARYYENGFIF